MPKSLQGFLVAVILVCSSAGITRYFHTGTSSSAEASAKIIGPASIAYAGQYATYHVDVPGKDPAKLIFTWAVEPICPIAKEKPLPEIRATSKAGEAQLDTVAGRWRLSCAIADPAAGAGQMTSMDVTVESLAPGPSPAPAPQPSPGPGPLPSPAPTPPTPPAPEPTSRFSQFTKDVGTWLTAVNSPDKANEITLIIQGTTSVIASLTGGNLSKLEGTSLRIAVASAVLANNSKIKNASAWGGFGSRVNAAVATAEKAGQLNSPADWAEFLTAFSAGLK